MMPGAQLLPDLLLSLEHGRAPALQRLSKSHCSNSTRRANEMVNTLRLSLQLPDWYGFCL